MSWNYDHRVLVPYADMAKLNSLKAWARRNRCSVSVKRYARDAYEGHVTVHSDQMTGRDEDMRRIAECRAIVYGRRATSVPAAGANPQIIETLPNH